MRADRRYNESRVNADWRLGTLEHAAGITAVPAPSIQIHVTQAFQATLAPRVANAIPGLHPADQAARTERVTRLRSVRDIVEATVDACRAKGIRAASQVR